MGSGYELHDWQLTGEREGKQLKHQCTKCKQFTYTDPGDAPYNNETCVGIAVPPLRELADALIPNKRHQAFHIGSELQTQLKGAQAKVARLKSELREAMLDEMVLSAVCSSAWRKYGSMRDSSNDED